MATILGLAASPRSGITAAKAPALLAALAAAGDETTLVRFLTEEAGPGGLGLCNSDITLAAALWAAKMRGADVAVASLREQVGGGGAGELPALLGAAEGMLLSGPVYFGDRGSLAHDFLRLVARDPALREAVRNMPFGGLAVGAKRNGGQETTLIYQILDVLKFGMLAVGNDWETTSQYGGTACAGHAGTAGQDRYGLGTSMGTGRRVASLAAMARGARALKAPVRVGFLVLQDAGGLAVNLARRLSRQNEDRVDARIIDVSGLDIRRCLACAGCPKAIGPDEEYRCSVGERDDMHRLHPQLLDLDALVPMAVSLRDAGRVRSNYQVFLERTRYLRRGDYALSNLAVAPLVLEEDGAREYLDVRMITSLIRHHTVIVSPWSGRLERGRLTEPESLDAHFKGWLESFALLAAARLSAVEGGGLDTWYKPVGYVLANENGSDEQALLAQRRDAVARRRERLLADANRRLEEDK